MVLAPVFGSIAVMTFWIPASTENRYSPVAASTRLENSHLADVHHRLARLAVPRHLDDRALEDPVEIPLIVRHVLVVPGQLAGLRSDRDGAVGVERVRVDADAGSGMEQRTRVVGRRDAEVDEVELGVVAQLVPDRAAAPLLERHVVPTVAVGLAGPGDGVEPPRFLDRTRRRSRRRSRPWERSSRSRPE